MDSIDRIIGRLTIEEKVAQLFITTPESLTRSDDPVLSCNYELEEALRAVPIGGILYFGRNLADKNQTKELLKKTQQVSIVRTGIPLFQSVDEEGGYISKVANNEAFGVRNIGTPTDLAKGNDLKIIRESGAYVGDYLSELGFNLDYAPCADVLTNEKNTVIEDRSYGSDPVIVANMAAAFAEGLLSKKILSSYKHFPGHGDTAGDSHKGYVYTNKTLKQLYECDLIPFIKGIEMGVPMIMVGHISFPNIIENDDPASLSKKIITELLREELGFDGVIISDSLKMKAVSESYTSKDASLKVLEAGADLILRPIDFYSAYEGIVEEARAGSLSEDRINESLRRILKLKRQIAWRDEV